MRGDRAIRTAARYAGICAAALGIFALVLLAAGKDPLKAYADTFQYTLANAYGLDTISAGVTIAWAMECFERGLLTREDTGGLEPRFGDAAAMVQLVELMGKREGLGRLLGEGSRRAAQSIGRGSEALAMQAKGLEFPMHEPRVKYTLGLGYAVSPTGADHNHNFHDSDYTNEEGIAQVRPFGILEPLPFDDMGPAKVRLAALEICWSTLNNVLGMCGFVYMLFDRPRIAAVVKAVTGWDTSLYELLKAGERAYTMARAFNARDGFDRRHDTLPQRFQIEPLHTGKAPGEGEMVRTLDRFLDEYYQLRNWTRNGLPTREKLEELGIK